MSTLNYATEFQAQLNWCWAAVTAAIDKFFGGNSVQCDIVNASLGQTTCCVDGSTPHCDQPWYLDHALNLVGHLHGVGAFPASLQQILQELQANRPLCSRIGWNLGGGHFVTIYGCYNQGGTDYIVIGDPFYGVSTLELALFPSSYKSGGAWTHTYWVR